MIPNATYRIQLNSEFDFNNLKENLPYFSKLGISHLYASPIFKARQGSRHGYDVIDSNQINDELGGPDAFEDLIKEAADLGLEWIQDIVPNHVAYSPETTMISDVMKFSDSVYHNILDVDWNYPALKLKGKILAPFLQESYKQSLRKGQIKLSYVNGFQIKYGDLSFPVKISSYKTILAKSNRLLSFQFQDEKKLLAKLRQDYNSDATFRTEIENILDQYNRKTELLDTLLLEQVYSLANWKTAFKEINYRRFFGINDLICLRMEERNAFETTHKLITDLLSNQKFAGLRVDHIDGLFDPETYLNKLRKKAPEAFIIAEKILLNDEKLSEKWPIQGTTGYDFLNQLNGLFVDEQNKVEVTGIYNEYTRSKQSFNEILMTCKKSVIQQYFKGDIENLTRMFYKILKNKAYGKKCTSHGVKKALIALLSCLLCIQIIHKQRKCL